MPGQGEIRYAVATGAYGNLQKNRQAGLAAAIAAAAPIGAAAAEAVRAPKKAKLSIPKKEVQKANVGFSFPSLREIGRQHAEESMKRAEKQSDEISEMKRRLNAEPNWFKKAGIVLGYMFTSSSSSESLTYDNYDGFTNY